MVYVNIIISFITTSCTIGTSWNKTTLYSSYSLNILKIRMNSISCTERGHIYREHNSTLLEILCIEHSTVGHAMPCHAMPCHAMPCHAMPCHAMPCHAMPCHAMPCHAMPCHAMPCHAMPCHAMPCYSANSYSHRTLHCWFATNLWKLSIYPRTCLHTISPRVVILLSRSWLRPITDIDWIDACLISEPLVKHWANFAPMAYSHWPVIISSNFPRFLISRECHYAAYNPQLCP